MQALVKEQMSGVANHALEAIPEPYREDVARAVEILKEVGCTEIYLFGSLTRGHVWEGTEIDLAVRGCPPDQYSVAVTRLFMALDRNVHLVDLDSEHAFAQFIEQSGRSLRVG